MDNKEKLELFKPFIGKAIKVVTTVTEYTGGKSATDTPKPLVVTNIDSSDESFVAINDIARANDLLVRFWLPETAGTAELRPNRINIKIQPKNESYYILSATVG